MIKPTTKDEIGVCYLCGAEAMIRIGSYICDECYMVTKRIRESRQESKSDLVSFHVSRLAKKFGFDQPCNWSYDEDSPDSEPDFFDDAENWNGYDECVSAPYKDDLMAWIQQEKTRCLDAIEEIINQLNQE
jgi:hypothetical protein